MEANNTVEAESPSPEQVRQYQVGTLLDFLSDCAMKLMDPVRSEEVIQDIDSILEEWKSERL